MSTGTTPPKQHGNRQNETANRFNPADQSDSAVRAPSLHGGRRTTPISTKTHHHQHPHPNGQTHIRRRAIWHRLFGTLLSSQGTDAHPSRSFNLSGGNRSN